jgi:hypothetical protein
MRLGPFPSSRHALKFAAYAAVGGSVAAWLGAIWTVPFLGAGFLLSVYRTEGRGLDEHLGDRLAFHWRAQAAPEGDARRPPRPVRSGPYLLDVPGHLVAVVAAPGIPIAFLPPHDARALFESYRDLLRSLERGVLVQMGVQPISDRTLIPGPGSAGPNGPVDAARRGYAEFVTLLCRQRYRRQVLLAVWEPSGPDAPVRLDRAADRLAEELQRMGIAAERLRDASLRTAGARLGWGEGTRP